MVENLRKRKPTFKVGHFPQYTANRKLESDLEWIVTNLQPTSGGLTEGAKRMDDIQDVLGKDDKSYRTFWDAHGGRPIEIPMFVAHREVTDVGFEYFPISPGIPGVSFVKPRGISVLRYKFDGEKVAHIHTHWDAVLQNKETGEVFSSAQRVEFAKRNSKRIEMIALQLIQNGYAVFITGDFNYKNFTWLERFKLWKHSPQRLFKRLDLKWKSERLDYLAWDAKLVRAEDIQVVKKDTAGNHGDHPYIVGTFHWKA